MPSKYDNWERLVGAVVKREQLRKIALSHSIDSDTFSFTSSSSQFDQLFLQSFIPEHDAIDDRSVSGVIFLPVEARELEIHTKESRVGQHPYSSRSDIDAIEINPGFLFDIRGKIKTHLLTSKTIYGAYLLFKLYGDELMGYESAKAKAMMKYGKDDRDVDAETRAKIVHLQLTRQGDRWNELQIGSFYVDDGDDREVEARLMETSGCRKTGFIVEGIEFRPLANINMN